MKKVSVVIPAYNKAEFTVRTVESVLNQTYQNIEIIVVDDGSTDDTQSRLKKYEGKINYVRKQNRGACSARNLGIQRSSGDYIALIDCDDIYYPDKIRKSVELLEKDSEIGFMYTSTNFIDGNDNIVSSYRNFEYVESGWIIDKLLEKNIIPNSTVVAKKICFKHVGYFDEQVFIPADWDMWIRLAEIYKAGYIDEPLSGYRISDTYTINNLDKGIKEESYVLDKTFKRNADVPKKIQNKSMSGVFYRYGLMNSAKGNHKQARRLFAKALANNPYNIKVGLLLAISKFAPMLLNTILKRKIVV